MDTTTTQAARRWDEYAAGREKWADYLDSRGEDSGATRAQAKQARDCAESLRLEAKTGISYCVCHLIPMTECRARSEKRRG